jgi:hypothetical protein
VDHRSLTPQAAKKAREEKGLGGKKGLNAVILRRSAGSQIHVFGRHRRVRRAGPTATLRHPASLRPGRYVRVPAFDRFDEILYLVEKTSDLTLPDFGRCHILVAI